MSPPPKFSMNRRRITRDRLSMLGINPGTSAPLPPTERLPLQLLAEHDIIKVIQKIDYIAFARMRRTCRHVGELIEDTISQYKITVPMNVVIDNTVEKGWTISKQKRRTTDGILYLQLPHRWSSPWSRGLRLYGMLTEKLERPYYHWKCGDLEAVKTALRGYRWKTIEITRHLDVKNNRPELFLGLEEIADLVASKCNSIRFSCFTTEDMEVWVARMSPSTVAILSDTPDFHELEYFPRLENVQNIELISPIILNADIRPLCRGKKSICAHYLTEPSTFTVFNEVLRDWQNGTNPLEFFEVKTRASGEAPAELIANLDITEFFCGKLENLHTMGQDIETSNTAVQSWLIRSQLSEDGHHAYGLLIYSYSTLPAPLTGPGVATFRKLARHPLCLCDNPICVDSITPLFFEFVNFCYPLDLSSLRDELMSKPAIPFLGRQFELYIFHQKLLLSQRHRNPFFEAKISRPG